MIVVQLDVMLARRKMRSKELAERIGITEANVSLLKSGKVKGVRFDTLEKLCAVLQCQPGDLLEYQPDDAKTSHWTEEAVGDEQISAHMVQK
jgi:putative transcriptional regulator